MTDKHTPDLAGNIGLRDYFAGQALVEIASLIMLTNPDTIKAVAKLAYTISDAMIEAREVKP